MALDSKITRYFKENEKRILDDFFTFLKFQSVSSELVYKLQLLDCAKWLQNYLKEIGFTIEVWETTGHPVIFATYLKPGPKKPTLLIYNHYDVQPIDPLNEWITPPFSPTIKNGEIYARGAQDNKGQCFYVIEALKSLIECYGTLPINIKLCIEGEEEVGSSGLSALLPLKKKELNADYLAIVDCGLQDRNLPAINLGMRGIITMDLEVEGSLTDLHSGSHGGVAYNPIHGLTEILAKLRDSQGKVLIPGFYDDIEPLEGKEKSLVSLDFNQDNYLSTFGILATGGERNLPVLERNWFRPCIEVNGIYGGYCGSGFKTVIPAKAHAKLSCRLVPNQTPEKVANLVIEYLKQQVPEGLKLKINLHPGFGKPIRSNPQSKICQAFSEAYQEVFNKKCDFILGGGSIPIAADLAQTSEAEIVLLGLGLPDDQIHAPNEHFGLDRLEKGFNIIARTLQILGTIDIAH